jgi:asparagine synthase (glutamine-hydrolysing)
VRLNRRRGRQAGDLVPRLRASAPEVEGALATVERGPAAEYVDVGWMRKAWRTIQVDDSMRSLRMADRILTRGIMAALFIERMR